ncbi:transcriptional regulator AcuR [Oerskovia enterophila]|uniref:Transcriptional regulator AcuR n=2 Tax=Oerskovia enterophila TaxID=43678 RepID=A0ABX2Y1E9_9CELL|nr:transcriptional regulator AcuR [Oerskovia enterophila]
MAELLWERGYAATSPRDVMARADVGQGSMYHHFDGKHGLALETLGAVAEHLMAEAVESEGEGTAIERLRRRFSYPRPGLLGCRLGRMTQDPQVVEDPDLLKIVSDAFETAAAQWAALVAEAVADGDLPATTDPDELASTLAAVVQGGYVLARAQGSQEPMDAAVRGALALLEAARPRPVQG